MKIYLNMKRGNIPQWQLFDVDQNSEELKREILKLVMT